MAARQVSTYEQESVFFYIRHVFGACKRECISHIRPVLTWTRWSTFLTSGMLSSWVRRKVFLINRGIRPGEVNASPGFFFWYFYPAVKNICFLFRARRNPVRKPLVSAFRAAVMLK